MPKTVSRKKFAGATYEEIIYHAPDGARNLELYDPERQKRERFENQAEYDRFKLLISKRNHARLFNANFSPTSLYSTLTCDTEHEIHTFEDARRIRRNFLRTLKRVYPDAVIFLYMGRGISTHRIHFHMVSEGVPKELIEGKWKYGSVKRIDHLREHNYYEGEDHGQDYTGLANYLFDHWTEEQGGHRWFMTKNARRPEEEPAEEIEENVYSLKNPPEPLAGYVLIESRATGYGYLHFKYVRRPPKRKPGRPRKTDSGSVS